MAKQKRFEARYKQLTAKPTKKEDDVLSVVRVPKAQRIKEIQYVFVVFKNCETREVILDKFAKESAAISCIKKCVGAQKIAPE